MYFGRLVDANFHKSIIYLPSLQMSPTSLLNYSCHLGYNLCALLPWIGDPFVENDRPTHNSRQHHICNMMCPQSIGTLESWELWPIYWALISHILRACGSIVASGEDVDHLQPSSTSPPSLYGLFTTIHNHTRLDKMCVNVRVSGRERVHNYLMHVCRG